MDLAVEYGCPQKGLNNHNALQFVSKKLEEARVLETETQDTAETAGYKAWGFLRRAVQEGTLTLKGENWYEAVRTPTRWVAELGPEKALKQQKKYAAIAHKFERDLLEQGKAEEVSALRHLWVNESTDGEDFVEWALGFVDPATLDKLEQEGKEEQEAQVLEVATLRDKYEHQHQGDWLPELTVPESLWKPLLAEAEQQGVTYGEQEVDRWGDETLPSRSTRWLVHTLLGFAGPTLEESQKQHTLRCELVRQGLQSHSSVWHPEATWAAVKQQWAEVQALEAKLKEESLSSWDEEEWRKEWREQNAANFQAQVALPEEDQEDEEALEALRFLETSSKAPC